MDLFEIEDMLWEVMRRLLYIDRKNFSFVNKSINAYYMRKRVGTVYRHGIPIYLGKDELIDQMLNSSTRINALIAPPSYGKTIVGLVLALSLAKRDNKLVYIIVPAKCVSMWDDAIKKLCPTNYLIDDPFNSLIINTYDKHAYYWDKKNLSINNRIIITSHIKFMNIIKKHYRNTPQIPINVNVVIDEAHMGGIISNVVSDVKKNTCFLLSATKICFPYNLKKKQTTIFRVARKEIKNNIPKYKLISSSKSLKTILPNYFSKNKKIVLFTHDMDLLVNKSKKIFSRWEKNERPLILRYRGSPEELHYFHDSDNKVLFVVTYTKADVGLSIKAEGAILHDAFLLDSRRIHQAVSRILRITNNTPSVKISLMYKKKSNENPLFIKIRLAAVWIKMKHEVTLSKTHYSSNAIKKGMRVIKEYGIDINNLSHIEVIYYCGPQVRLLATLYEKAGLLEEERHSKVLTLYRKKK